MNDQIRLTLKEWSIVTEQCSKCQFWGYSKGCMLPDTADNIPVPNCHASQKRIVEYEL